MRNAVAVAVVCFSVWGVANAGEAGAVTRQSTQIAAQGLGPALESLAKERDFQVLYRTEIVGERRTAGASGDLTLEEALAQLLVGTGLTYRRLDERTVTIVPVLQGGEARASFYPSASSSVEGAQGAGRHLQVAAGDVSPVQDESTSEDAEGSQDTSVPAQHERSKIQEIVVTAQKRGEESITEVPISISVLNGASLEASGARGVADALNQVGGVNLVEIEPGRSTIAVRGASAASATLAGSSPVGYYLDELPFSWISNAIVPDANAYDLERVEVLRGPQGTLYGANSLNGVVRILSNDANLSEFQIRGRVRTGWTDGGDGSQGGDMVVNLPLVTDRLGVRAVASYANIGGYIDVPTEADFNDSEIQNYRLKIHAKPTDRLSIELAAYFSRIDNNGAPATLGNYTMDAPAAQGIERQYDAYNLVASYDFANFNLLSSTGYIDLTGAGNNSVLLPPQVNFVDNLRAEAFTQEVRFNSNFEGPWKLSGGGYYRTMEQVLNQSILAFFRNPLEFTDTSNQYAVFGEVTRSFLNDRLELTGGIRYFEDAVRTTEQSTLVNGTAGPFIVPRKSNFDAVTWRTVAAYHLNEDRTLYASVATGFRGGFNQAATSLAAEPTLPDIKPDDLLTYEIGFKGEAWDGRLFFDTAVYCTKWNDTQQLRPTPIRTAAVINAESVSGFGADASVIARPTDNLTLTGNLGWNSLEFDGDTLLVNSLGTFVLLPEGERMNASPELTIGVGAEYTFPLGANGLEGFVAGDARYTSHVVTHDVVSNRPVLRVYDDIHDTNLRVGLQSDNWTISAFAENVLNENGALGPVLGQPLPVASRQRPLTVGLQATFKY